MSNAIAELSRVAESLCEGTRYTFMWCERKEDDDGGYYEMIFRDALADEFLGINLPESQAVEDSIVVLVAGWERVTGAPQNAVTMVEVKLGYGPN
jgi:hypothetical protein